MKKFQDRNKAATRVWRAIQSLAPQELPEPTTPKPEAQPQAGKRRKPAQKAGRAKQAGRANPAQKPMADRSNKKAEVIALMMRAKGSTLAEIMEATRWQKHTVRGFVSLLGSRDGLTIHSALNAAGERTYTITN